MRRTLSFGAFCLGAGLVSGGGVGAVVLQTLFQFIGVSAGQRVSGQARRTSRTPPRHARRVSTAPRCSYRKEWQAWCKTLLGSSFASNRQMHDFLTTQKIFYMEINQACESPVS